MESAPLSVRDIISSIVFYAAVIFLCILLIRVGTTYGFEKVHLKFTVMEPRLERGNYVLVNKRDRAAERLAIGDVIAYRRPVWKRAEYKHEFARVVGKPGDLVEMKDHKLYRAERMGGKLGLKEMVSEPYLNPRHRPRDFSAFVVPRNTVLVMYDNRRRREPLRGLLVPVRTIHGRVIR